MTFTALRALHSLIGEALDDIERIYRDASHDSPTPTTPYTVLTGLSPYTPYVRRGSRDEEETVLANSPDDELTAAPSRSPKTPRRTRESSLGAIPFPSSNTGSTEGTVQQLDFPGLDTPYYPTDTHEPEVDTAESLASHPDVIAATNRIVAACGQISATVHRPFLTLCDAAMGYHLPACLSFLEKSHTVEILRAAGPHGMHVRDLSRHLNVEEGKLGHILRLLATHHITREVRPNVFANNRISAIVDSGKSWEELRKAPQDKYEATNGIAAFVNLCTDELFKSAAYLTDCYLPSPSKKDADDASPMHAPFNLAFDTKTPYFEWLERPGNEMRLKRFGPAMTGTAAWEVPGAVTVAFPWQELADDSLIVDVGGGIGSTAMLLAHTFSHLRFVIQDRPQVAEQGLTAWRERCPEMLDSGRAMFLGHDFFCPQPPIVLPGLPSQEPTIPAVYILRVVTHDWPDTFVVKILLNLRKAAGPSTKLLIADHILSHACVDEHEDMSASGPGGQLPVSGMVRSLAPEGSPLLPNLGKANANAYWLDLTMRATFNAQERTLREMAALTLMAGWQIVAVVHGEDSLFGHITAVPVDIPEQSLKLLDPPAPLQSPGATRARSASTKSSPESMRMNSTFGTHTVLPSEEAIRKPARKARRSLLPWLRGRPSVVPTAVSVGDPMAQVTPENEPRTTDSGTKSGKGRRPKLSILTSPSSSFQDKDRERERSSGSGGRKQQQQQQQQHTRTSSVVRMFAQASKSVVNLGLQDSEATSAVRFRDDQSIPPLPSRSARCSQVPPVPPVPALLPAFDEPKVKSMPSRTSLRKKASQVFGLSKASIANLRAAALGGGGSGERDKDRGGVLAAIEGSPAGASTTRLSPPEVLVERGTRTLVEEKPVKERRGGRLRAGSRARFAQAGLGGAPTPITVEVRPQWEERWGKLRRPGSSNV